MNWFNIVKGFLVVYHQVKSLHLANNSCLQGEDINMYAYMFPNMELLDMNSCEGMYEGVGVKKKCCNIRHLNFVFCPQAKHFFINFEASKLSLRSSLFKCKIFMLQMLLLSDSFYK